MKAKVSKAVLLVLGSGGREHALAWKLAQSKSVQKIYCAPGNGGTASTDKSENVDIAVDDFLALIEFAQKNKVTFTVVGPDNPLADGIVDRFQAAGLKIFGPTRAAAQLEASKTFGKEFMTAAGIPTPRYAVCTDFEHALSIVKENAWARVIKADGLALGKGVFVCDSEIECRSALEQIFKVKVFGAAGLTAIIEEKIIGEELSLLLFCDGKNLVPMPASQDHKRRFDNDKGPNTGGMGCYAPVALFEQYKEQIQKEIIEPLTKALSTGEILFQGILYAGIIVGTEETAQSDKSDQPRQPKVQVLEFNARFGDPETQALMPLLESDLYSILVACAEGRLPEVEVTWSDKFSCCVVAAAESYPQASSRGEKITINSLNETLAAHVQIFHAGTRLEDKKGLTTNGGRVLAVTATASSLQEAREGAYEALRSISFKGLDYRKDIAGRALTKCLST
jgi:phosphoribosylamine--glycine ligase